MTALARRRAPLALALMGALAMLTGLALPTNNAGAAPSHAAPPTPSPGPTPGPEGESGLLRDVIERTSRAYVEAKNAVKESQKKQLALRTELDALEARKAALAPQAAEIARQSYQNGRLGPMLMLLGSDDSDAFLQRAEMLEILSSYDNKRLADLADATERIVAAKALLDRELKREEAQLAQMAKQKAETEAALKITGGRVTGGFVDASSPVARQSPKGSNGGFPGQSCSVKDPTTGRCITPRMLFALKETQRLGFKRYVSCFRSGGPFEHPKGRACDFSAFKNDFGRGDAKGNDRLYGNNLAAFHVRNADKLGVLYVIWYRQIWTPAVGWRSYGSAYGDPSSDHTNHVHLSVL